MDPFVEIAARFGVRVIDGRNPEEDNMGFGPNDDDCDVFARVVYRAKGRPNLKCESGRKAFAFVFHELAHVVCAIPYVGRGDGINWIDESFVLLPFEERLAAAVAPPSTHAAIKNYQLGTQVYAGAFEWGDDRPIIARLRREGLARARKVGLLDKENEPTFQQPDWSRLGLRSARSIG